MHEQLLNDDALIPPRQLDKARRSIAATENAPHTVHKTHGRKCSVRSMTDPKLERVFSYPFGDIYNNYVAKVERTNRTRGELDDVLGWFTGLSPDQLAAAGEQTLREFFEHTAQLPASAELITGSVCGVKVQEVDDPLMRKIRMMDKLVDELAKGKALEKVKRG
ncbi:hypothetical protein GCM10009631_09660 [Corynebacterium glaucum]